MKIFNFNKILVICANYVHLMPKTNSELSFPLHLHDKIKQGYFFHHDLGATHVDNVVKALSRVKLSINIHNEIGEIMKNVFKLVIIKGDNFL